MYANRHNFCVLKEIGVEEHDGDVRFFTGSENTAVSRMLSASGRNYGTVRSLLTWLWGRYHVPQNAFLVYYTFIRFEDIIQQRSRQMDATADTAISQCTQYIDKETYLFAPSLLFLALRPCPLI